MKIDLALQDLNAFKAESNKTAGEILVLVREIASAEANIANVKAEITATTEVYEQNDVVLNALKTNYSNYQSVSINLKYDLGQKTLEQTATDAGVTALKESIASAENTLAALKLEETSLTLDTNNLAEEARQLETLYAEITRDIELTQLKIDSKLQEELTLDTSHSDLKDDLTLAQRDSEEYTLLIVDIDADILAVTETISAKQETVASLNEVIYEKKVNLESDVGTLNYIQNQLDDEKQELTLFKEEYDSRSSQPLASDELYTLELQIDEQTVIVNNLIYDKALKEQSIKTTLLGLESDHNTNHFLLDEIAILEAELLEKQEDKKTYEQRRTETIELFDLINTDIADTEAKILNVAQETEELIAGKAGYEQASVDTKVLITETQTLLDDKTISLSNVRLSIQNEEAELLDSNKYLLVKIRANSATDEGVNAIILDIQETEGILAEVNLDIKTAEATASTLTEKTLGLKSRQTELSNDILAKGDIILLKTEAYDSLDIKIKDTFEKIDCVLTPQKIDYENKLIQVDNTSTSEKLELDEKIKTIAAMQESIAVEEDKLTVSKQEFTTELEAAASNDEELTKTLSGISTLEGIIAQTKLDIKAAESYIADLSNNYDSSKLNEKIIYDKISNTDAKILLLNTENLQAESNIKNLGGIVLGLTDSKTLNEDKLLATGLKISETKQAILLAETDRDGFIAQKTQADSNILVLEGAKDNLISEKTLISANIYDTGLLIKKLNDDELAKENKGLLIDSQIADNTQLIDDKTADVNIYLSSSEAIKSDLLVLDANLLDSTEKSDALQIAITGYITDIPAAEENLNKQTLLVENIITDLAMAKDESGQLELLRDSKIQDIAFAESDVFAKQNLIAENEQIYEGIILDVSSVEQEKTVSIQQLGDIKATLEEKTNTYNILSDNFEQKEDEFYKTDEEVRVLKYKIDEEIIELQNIQTFNPNIVTIYVDTNPFNVLPRLDIDKKVYDEGTGQWVDFLSVYNGDEVSFNITVLNVGDVIIPDITVTDALPIDILAYIPDSSSPFEPTITKNILSWNFNSIAPGETIFIEFSSSCIKTGTNDNYAFAMGEYPIHEFNTAIAVKIISDNVTINVMEIPVNNPPEAVDDNVEVSEDSTDNTLDVLSNDLDSDENDVLSIQSIQIQPENGNAYIDQGMIIYNPNSNFYGQDSIVYRITDNNGSFDTGNVYITITNINDNPVATADNVGTPENTPVDIPVLNNDYDVDEDDLVIEGVDVEPEYGLLSINSGIMTYTPTLGYNGSDSFVYNISDGNNAYSTAIVNIDVYVVVINHPPVAEDDVKYVFKDSNINVIRALANDHDSDEGDSITLDTILVPPSNGSARILGEYILYTPEEGFNGTDVLTYRIVDSYSKNDTATVTIHVRERSQKTISKPKEGGFLYLWGNELFSIEPLLDLLDCEALIIGPIDIHVNVSETSDIPIEYTKLYVAGDEKVNTTERNFNWTWDETVFGICTIKIVMYSEDTELIDEMDVLIFNLGNTLE